MFECQNQLERQLESFHKSSINLIARRYSFCELAQKSLKKFCKHFDIFSKSSDFEEIDFDSIQRILDSEEWFNTTEEKISEAVMHWVNFGDHSTDLTQIGKTVEYCFN